MNFATVSLPRFFNKIVAPSHLIRRSQSLRYLLAKDGFVENPRVSNNNVRVDRKMTKIVNNDTEEGTSGQGRVEKVLGPVGPVRPKFVLFGSSIVQYSFAHGGWGAHLVDIYSRKADIFLRGYAAWNTRRALAVLDEVFPKDAILHPSLVIVYWGGNDSIEPHDSGLGPHVPLEEYVENMRKIANHLKGLSDTTRLIFLSCPPVKDQAEVGQNEARKKYSDALIKLCNEMNLKVIDLFSAIYSVEDWKETCFIDDGLHFTAAANEKVTIEILKVLKEAEWSPSLHWKSMPTEYSEDSPYYPVYGGQTLNVSNNHNYRGRDWD